VEAESQVECAEEPEAENPTHMDLSSMLNDVEPGSLVVIKSAVPNQPGKEMVQVYFSVKFWLCGIINDFVVRCSWFHPQVKVQL
jgi:hypothetical protein